MVERDPGSDIPGRHQPSATEVDELLRRAAVHPLGTDFLVNGALDAVAATFRAHAFVVDAARVKLREGAAVTAPAGPDAAAPLARTVTRSSGSYNRA